MPACNGPGRSGGIPPAAKTWAPESVPCRIGPLIHSTNSALRRLLFFRGFFPDDQQTTASAVYAIALFLRAPGMIPGIVIADTLTHFA